MKFLVKVMRYKHKEAMGQENAEDREAMRTVLSRALARMEAERLAHRE